MGWKVEEEEEKGMIDGEVEDLEGSIRLGGRYESNFFWNSIPSLYIRLYRVINTINLSKCYYFCILLID